jgi:Ca2+-binding EF-hand superfamily protein
LLEFGEELSADELEMAFDHFDKNNDEGVDFDEFL